MKISYIISNSEKEVKENRRRLKSIRSSMHFNEQGIMSDLETLFARLQKDVSELTETHEVEKE